MGLNDDLEGLLNGIHNSYYQIITIDKENDSLKVSNPWNGWLLYVLGFRTNVDDLSHYLLDKARSSIDNLESNRLTAKERTGVLASVKLLKRILKQNSVRHSKDEEKFFEEIKNIKTIFIKSLSNEPVPIKPHEIIEEISELGTEKMSMRDHVEQKIRLDERTKQVLKSYKEIEIGTKNMQLDPSKAETFNYYGWELNNDNYKTISKKTFSAYPLTQSQKFMVHATHLSNITSLAEKFQQRDFSASTMCVSLIDANTSFYRDSSIEAAALILAVDPRGIVLTSPTDIQTPVPRYEHKSKEKQTYAYQFYHTHQSLIRLGQRIEQIHKASGFVKSERVELQEIIKKITEKIRCIEILQSLLEDYLSIIKYQCKNKSREEEIQQLSQEIEENKSSIRNLELQLKEILNRLEGADTRDALPIDYYHYLPLSLKHLMMYYYENPEKNHSPLEFQKIFGYQGKDINGELEKYVSFLAKSPLIRRGYIGGQRLEFPDDLLALREQFQEYNYFKHTEINIKLDSIHARTPTVEGIILTRKTIEAHFCKGKNPLDPKVREWSWVIQFAQQKGIPIFIKDDPEDLSLPRAKL